MLAIWSLVPLPFLNPVCTSRSSQFTYCWSLAWRLLNIILLACKWVHLIWTFFGNAFLWDWNENWLFQSYGHCSVFQIFWHIHCSTLIALSFRVWNSSTKISSPLISSVQSLSCVWLFATPWISACQASLSITHSQSSLKLTSIESVMPSSHLILCRPLLLLPPTPPSISLCQWVNPSHEVAKVLEFQL